MCKTLRNSTYHRTSVNQSIKSDSFYVNSSFIWKTNKTTYLGRLWMWIAYSLPLENKNILCDQLGRTDNNYLEIVLTACCQLHENCWTPRRFSIFPRLAKSWSIFLAIPSLKTVAWLTFADTGSSSSCATLADTKSESRKLLHYLKGDE